MSRFEAGNEVGGRYEIKKRLGLGGFAEVYEAWDSGLSRTVALKVMLTADQTDDEDLKANFLARFRNEAMLAARVDHPNVVQIFDVGQLEASGEPYIVMEYLDGHDLDVHLRKFGPLAPERGLRLFSEVLLALARAHEHGIVHKDLKPSNLFMTSPETRFERLSILDFGVAHLEHALQGRITREGQVVGTPCYLAPEYATERIVTPALDVYQMGLILAEVLSGRVVVEHDDAVATMFAHVRGDLDFHPALLGSPLGPVLVGATALDHEERFENAMVFHEALIKVSPGDVPDLSDGASVRQAAQRSGAIITAESGGSEPVTGDHRVSPTGERESTRQMFRADESGERASSTSGESSAAEGKPAAEGAPVRTRVAERDDKQSQPVPDAEPGAGASTAEKERTHVDRQRTQAAGVVGADPGVSGVQTGPRPWQLGALLGAVLLTGLAFAFWPAPPAAEQITTPTTTVQPPETTSAPEKSAVSTPGEQPSKAEEQPPKMPSLVLVQVNSRPSGAVVVEGPRELGATPLELEFFSEDEQGRDVELQSAGYLPLHTTIQPDDQPSVTLVMKRAPEPKTKPKPKPKPRPARPTPSAKPTKPKGPTILLP